MRESPSIDEAWRTALIERADASRLHRGRNYVRNGRVVDLTIEPGRIIARVKGSRSRPYQVLITVPTFEGDSGDAIELVPASDRIEFMCTCPDWGDPCKHGVAVWLTVAGGLTETIEPLLALRGIRADGDVGESGNGHAPEPESGPAVAQAANLVPGRESRSADAGPTREQFWEGDLSVFEHESGGEGSVPAWVFVPPIPWPLKTGPSYQDVMEKTYERLRAGARNFLEELERRSEGE